MILHTTHQYFKYILFLYFLLILTGCNSNTEVQNSPPQIQRVYAEPDSININEITNLNCEATDNQSLTYTWNAIEGSFPGGITGQTVQWQAQDRTGFYYVTVEVSDGEISAFDSTSVFVGVLPSNLTPENDSTISPFDVILSWNCGGSVSGNFLYDVFLGETTNPILVSSKQSDTIYTLQSLEGNKTFYWKIIAYDNDNNSFSGPTWSFHTTTSDKRDFELGNTGVMISMVWIPPGNFMMGAPGTSGAGDDEAPSHQVTIANGFWMGEFEVTQVQWEAVMGQKNFSYEGDNRPADGISWFDAKSFIQEINDSEPNTPWRLPTEAEWEYAARGGIYNTRFWWGNDYSYTEVVNYAWISTNSGGQTHDVGTTTGGVPNPYGLWDMGGNVWEWCEDWYHWGYIGAPDDGSAWVDPPGTQRIFRGGAFYIDGRRCLPNLRSLYAPSGHYPSFGFRIVREQ